MSSTRSREVRFDVGGHHYKVSRSMLELYPHTMLARLISDDWNNSNNDDDKNVIFIDRNGHRFQYVLDFMRDQEVNLPVTESIEAIMNELEYYGFDNVRGDETSFSSSMPRITAATPVEAGRILAFSILGTAREELDSLDTIIKKCKETIKDSEYRKSAVKLARSLFEISISKHEDAIKNEKPFTVSITQDDEQNYCDDVKKFEAFFREKLASYGLQLISYNMPGSWTGKPQYLELKSKKKTSD